MSKSKVQTISISTSTILKTFLVLVAFYLVYTLRDIVLIFFLSIILAAGIDPLIDNLVKRKIPRSLAVLFVYLGLLFVFGLISVLFIPPLQQQFQLLSERLPFIVNDILAKGMEWGFIQSDFSILESIRNDLTAVASGLLNLTGDGLGQAAGMVFSGALGGVKALGTILLTFVLTFYLVVQDRGMRRLFQAVAPPHWRPYLQSLTSKIHTKMGDWLRGQLLLSVIIFVITAIALLFLEIPYWLLLALVAGVLEIIPFLGPVFSMFAAVLLVFAMSPVKALAVFLVYLVIQQIENSIIVPKIMEKAVGLNPIVVILAVLIGFKLAGLIGGLIAIPTATVFSVVLKDLFQRDPYLKR